MARPKHRTTSGATYFVTTDTWNRRAVFRNPTAAQIVLEKLFEYRDKGHYRLHAFVVMPDHLHLLITPGQTTSLEEAIRLIKGGSSYAIGKRLHRRFPIWHSGFTEHQIRDQRDFALHLRYIEENPVKARLSFSRQDYPYSSACRETGLDPWRVASGAKAHEEATAVTAGLKPRPSPGSDVPGAQASKGNP